MIEMYCCPCLVSRRKAGGENIGAVFYLFVLELPVPGLLTALPKCVLCITICRVLMACQECHENNSSQTRTYLGYLVFYRVLNRFLHWVVIFGIYTFLLLRMIV